MATMNDMPPELLSIILRLADPRVASNDDSKTQSKQKFKDMLPPNNFPFNLANVCTLWRDVLSLYPEYWTTLCVFVDAVQPTPLSELARYLQYSKDLPLNLVVTRTLVPVRYPFRYEEDANRTRVVIKMLRPHFPRCWSIHFDLYRGSALPSLSKDLAVRSSELSSLVLSCEVDDDHPPINFFDVKIGVPARPAEENSAERRYSIHTPSALTRLDLSGYTIMDAIKYSPSLFQNDSEEFDVTLSTYDITDLELPQSELIIQAFLRALEIPGDNAHITLDRINLPYLGDLDYPSSDPAASFHLRNLNSDMMQNMLVYVEFENSFELTIEDCELDSEDCPSFPSSIHLNLIDLEPDVDLSHFLSSFSIGVLSISNCECFDDEVIRMLARRRSDTECFVDHLSIHNCTNFSKYGVYLNRRSCPRYIKRRS
ncbi:hypothetical protein CPB83DRAFT_218203 [Crepidotus variabilis]|uniref:F-box domain-containing protein n=1 Tax=Crepidotus variabilis TaxID=179855 RepID=A0A9P6JWP3_9AGAR|nr:hypothetical protein CPB83DRAFT_218203 [Crepidotus variabilis]